MLDIKVKPLNEDPNKVLELLNENKHNLSNLVMQYDNIIELYIQLLGCGKWGKANVNEVILPEIIILLENSDYDCTFTKEGIYSNDKLVFSFKINQGYVNEEQISIIDGKNEFNLFKEAIEGEPQILSKKEIADLSKMTEEDFRCLSYFGRNQLKILREQERGNLRDDKYKFIKKEKYDNLPMSMCINNVYINSTIESGVEVSKSVEETYVKIKDGIYDILQNNEKVGNIYSLISYGTHQPVIIVKTTIDNEMPNIRYQLYGADIPDTQERFEVYYNYGETKLQYDGIILESRSSESGDFIPDLHMEDDKECDDTKYDYEKILENIQSYKNKYSSISHHPFITNAYLGKYTTKFGKKLKNYLDTNLEQSKTL